MKGFAVCSTSEGFFRIEYENDAVTSLQLVQAVEDWGCATPLTERVCTQLNEYFNGSRMRFDFACSPQGTAFQRKVWDALRAIPYGETRTYQALAHTIGSPKACRAVGTACHVNPLPIVVPCHRVVGAGGALGGYAYGVAMKQALLALEAAHQNQ